MPKNARTYIFLAAVLILGLALSILLFSGPFYSFDDMNYILYARQMLSGSFGPVQSPYAYGFGMPLTIAFFFSILGASLFASIIPILLEYFSIIILVFIIAARLYGDRIGLISSFLVATAPFVVGYSTRILSDMGGGMLTGISILFLILAQEKNQKEYYFLSGIFATLTIYMKLIGLSYVFFFIIAAFVSNLIGPLRPKAKKISSNLSFAYLGLALVIFIYLVALSGFGNPLLPFIKYGQNQSQISPTNLNNNLATLNVVLFSSSNTRFAPFIDPQTFPFGLIVFFTILGTAIGIGRRSREIILLSILFWGVLLYLFFGSESLTSYSLITVISRYFILISVPMAVLSGYGLALFANSLSQFMRFNTAYLESLFILLILLSNIPVYYGLYNYNLSISGDARTISSLLRYLSANSNGIDLNVYVSDNYTLNYMEFLSLHNPNIKMHPFSTSGIGVVKNELSQICLPNAQGTYLIMAYENHSASYYSGIFSSWIGPNCNLAKTGTYADNVSSGSIYNGMNLRADLYRINS